MTPTEWTTPRWLNNADIQVKINVTTSCNILRIEMYFVNRKTIYMSSCPSLIKDFTAQCPNCSWIPPKKFESICEVCNGYFDPLAQFGKCPFCDAAYKMCCDKAGNGCGQSSLIEDWYVE